MNIKENKYEIVCSSRFSNCSSKEIITPYSIIFPKRGGAILTNKKRKVLRMPICIDSNTMAMTMLDDDIFLYINLWFSSIDLGKFVTGSAVPQINNKDIEPMLVPLPPQKEQYRIVAKIEKLTPLIEDYDKKESDLSVLENKFPNDLKKSILQDAIMGKLVPQDSSDEPASELIKRIKAEKEKLIKEGKLKHDKNESIIYKDPSDNCYYERIGKETRCIDDEIPFDIPDSWAWVSLEYCCVKEIRRGKSPKYVDKSNTLVFAQKCNTKYKGINISLALSLDESSINKYTEDDFLQDCDIVVNSTGTGTLGRIGMYRSNDNLDNKPIVPDSHVTVLRVSKLLNCKYILYFLKANQTKLEKQGDGSTNQKELKPITLKKLLIPIPPKIEQSRIISKVEELLSILSSFN